MNVYVDEKSDSVIVLTKPSNKEGLSLAETVEGRMLPEGNSDQETAVRTQSRAAALSAAAAGHDARDGNALTHAWRCVSLIRN